MEITAVKQFLPKRNGSIVCVRKGKCFLITIPARPPALSFLIKCCRKRKAVSPVFIGKFLLYFLSLFSTKRRICQNDIEAITFLDVEYIFCERVGVNDIWSFDAMQDHVHDADNVCQRFLFLSRRKCFFVRVTISAVDSLLCFFKYS